MGRAGGGVIESAGIREWTRWPTIYTIANSLLEKELMDCLASERQNLLYKSSVWARLAKRRTKRC
jgi:hypothetical protein